MAGLSKQNKIYVVRYYDKYGIVHNCAYSRLDNAQKRYAEEVQRSRFVTLKRKRRKAM